MAKLIPASNDIAFSDIEKKIRLIEDIGPESDIDEMHIDVSDGSFTPTGVWHEPKDMEGFNTSLALELHLMLADIDDKIEDWLSAPVQRLIFHIETSQNPQETIKRIKEAGKETGIAISPETPIQNLAPFFDLANLILILGVHPGASGQEMLAGTKERITELRNLCGNCIIIADGGVTAENAGALARAGADKIAATSAIFEAENPEEVVFKLVSEISK